ncbi:MAG: type II toxin-antitoxin system VapC family toxin [Pyrinomonadaceae bacterium]
MVVDANLLVVIVSGDPRRERVVEQFIVWLDQHIELDAPSLSQYEVINALTRLVVAGQLKASAAKKASADLLLLPVNYQPILRPERVLEIALQLGRQTAYDAAYLALAEELNTELWTLDGPLYRNASGLGFPVRLLV